MNAEQNPSQKSQTGKTFIVSAGIKALISCILSTQCQNRSEKYCDAVICSTTPKRICTQYASSSSNGASANTSTHSKTSSSRATTTTVEIHKNNNTTNARALQKRAARNECWLCALTTSGKINYLCECERVGLLRNGGKK